MSSVLPFDIIALIIDIVGEKKDTDLLKELALVCHFFLQICSKHIFASVELHNADYNRHSASSKKGFVKLLKSNPGVVKYIRKLTYKTDYPSPILENNDDLLSPILPNFLQTIPRLNCLKINASTSDWYLLNSSLRSAFLHLMHLPTINHIGLSSIKNFPLSSLPSSANLHRLDILYLKPLKKGGSPEIVVEKMPRIREFHTSHSSEVTTKFLNAKRQDGQPASNFMDLRRLSMTFTRFGVEEEWNIRYLLQNAKSLEKLHLSVYLGHRSSFVGILAPSARTLKFLDLTVFFCKSFSVPLLAGLSGELEAMAGDNMLEALSFEVRVDARHTKDFIGSIFQKVEKILVKPGWSALRQLSFKVTINPHPSRRNSTELAETLQSLIPEKNLSHLSKLESVAFNYSACVFELPD